MENAKTKVLKQVVECSVVILSMRFLVFISKIIWVLTFYILTEKSVIEIETMRGPQQCLPAEKKKQIPNKRHFNVLAPCCYHT